MTLACQRTDRAKVLQPQKVKKINVEGKTNIYTSKIATEMRAMLTFLEAKKAL